MKFIKILTYKIYFLIFLVLYFSFEYISKNKIEEGFDHFVKYGILPLLLFSAIRHIFFSGKVFKSHPFFEIEAGGANLGIFIGLLIGYLFNIGIEGISCILIIFIVYLLTGAYVHYRYIGFKSALPFIPLIGVLSYFVYLGFWGYAPTRQRALGMEQ